MHVVAVPLHPPLQPEKRRPATGLAVRTTDWPDANVAVAELQVVPQVRPVGVLVTVPKLLVPDFVSCSV